MNPLYERLKYRTPLRLRGFETLYSSGEIYSPESHEQLMLNDQSFQENYDKFKKIVIDNIGIKYFPIYRMADGEFKFVLLPKKGLLTGIKRRLARKDCFSTCWGEKYTSAELKEIGKDYINQLKEIQSHGYLALHFVDWLEGDSYQNLIEPMCRWFDKNDIVLTEENYTSFYYIYAIFTGPDRVLLFKNRNILIISSIDQERRQKITERLIKIEKASRVEFYDISPSKSMFDKINLKQIKEKPELILVAAGVGSANILTQLNPLNTVCIDVGIVIETFSNPSLKKSRIFLQPNF